MFLEIQVFCKSILGLYEEVKRFIEKIKQYGDIECRLKGGSNFYIEMPLSAVEEIKNIYNKFIAYSDIKIVDENYIKKASEFFTKLSRFSIDADDLFQKQDGSLTEGHTFDWIEYNSELKNFYQIVKDYEFLFDKECKTNTQTKLTDSKLKKIDDFISKIEAIPPNISSEQYNRIIKDRDKIVKEIYGPDSEQYKKLVSGNSDGEKKDLKKTSQNKDIKDDLKNTTDLLTNIINESELETSIDFIQVDNSLFDNLILYLRKFYPCTEIEKVNEMIPDIEVSKGKMKGESYIKLPFFHQVIKITRKKTFEDTESSFFRYILDFMKQFKTVRLPDVMCENIIESAFDLAVMITFLGNNILESLPNTILKGVSYWRNKTYEGKNVSMGIHITESGKKTIDSLNLDQILTEDYFAPVTDGVNSFLSINSEGFILGHLELPNMIENVDLPFRFSTLSEKPKDKFVLLTRLGDVILISNKKIDFVKKDKQWTNYSLQDIAKKLTAYSGASSDVANAVYATCLDVSFAKTGCIIGIVSKSKKDEFKLEDHINKKIFSTTEYKNKTMFWKILVGNKRFQELNRTLRKELASMDGALIIDYEGNIIAVGTIFGLDGVSLGGGRTAATQEVSKSGNAIKVSTDGYIQPYRSGKKMKFRIE